MADAELRDRAILFARRRGASLAELGRRYKLSRERVRQILAQKAAPMAHELSARLRNAIQNEGCEVTPAAVARRFSLAELRRVPNLGTKSIAELNSWLQRHGLDAIT